MNGCLLTQPSLLSSLTMLKLHSSSMAAAVLLSSWLHAVAAASSSDLSPRSFVSGTWTLSQHGMTGVAGQQMTVTTESKVIIYDKVEHNPLQTNGHLAWGAEYNLETDAVRPLNPLSNSWCAAGSYLGNGTQISTGGNPVDLASEAGDISGLQAIRFFTPCDDETCDVQEFPTTVRLTSPRWYPSSVRLDDGSVMIFGGSTAGGFINNAGMNNPTYEFFPPKNINGHNGTQIQSQFLRDTLNGNHFPIMMVLNDGTLFVAANQQAMILNWRTNTETRLPSLPNGVRVTSPFSASAVLLPLSSANSYTPEVLICGGSQLNDTQAPTTFSSQSPTYSMCSRMVLNAAGIAAGWQLESMGTGRIMADAILLPDGRIFLVSGAHTGVAGYGNVAHQVGQSNADNPAFQPMLYDPAAPSGSRFSTTGLPASSIARLYHSVATLTPNGTVMVAGSNPNADVTTVKYPTEYRVEWFTPAYFSQPRPSYTGLPAVIGYGSTFTLTVSLPAGVTAVSVSLMDLGFATHAVHMDHRLVLLSSTLASNGTQLTVTAPPSGMIYPPGPAFLYVLTSAGVPSFGHKTIIGTGASPPVDLAASANLLRNTVKSLVDPDRPLSGEGAALPTATAAVH